MPVGVQNEASVAGPPSPLVSPFVVHAVATTLALPLLLTVPETNPVGNRASRIRVELGVPASSRRRFWIVVVPATA